MEWHLSSDSRPVSSALTNVQHKLCDNHIFPPLWPQLVTETVVNSFFLFEDKKPTENNQQSWKDAVEMCVEDAKHDLSA